jgi:hypothetical protein
MKALLGLLVVILAGYIAFQFLPPYFSKYQFSDDVNSIARFSGPTTKTEEEIREEVMKKAREYELPLKAEQVMVTREGQSVNIKAHYTKVVSLVGGKDVPLEFDVQSDK